MITAFLLSLTLPSGKTLPFAQWPLEVLANQVYVHPKLQGGKLLTMILDTGSPQTYLSSAALGQKPTNEIQSKLTVLSSSGFGIVLHALLMSAKNDRITFGKGKGFLRDGVFGLDAFDGMRVGIDFAGEQISFYETADPIEKIISSYYPQHNFLSSDSQTMWWPSVPVKIDGFDKNLIVDTGTSLTVFPSNQSKPDVPRKSADLEFSYWGKKEHSKLFSGLEIQVAGLKLSNRKVGTFSASPMPTGILGLWELRSLRLFYDGVAKRLYYAPAGGDLPQAPEILNRPWMQPCNIAEGGQVVVAPPSLRLHIPTDAAFTVPDGFTAVQQKDNSAELIPEVLVGDFSDRIPSPNLMKPVLSYKGALIVMDPNAKVRLRCSTKEGVQWATNYAMMPIQNSVTMMIPPGLSIDPLTGKSILNPFLRKPKGDPIILDFNAGVIVVPKNWTFDKGNWNEEILTDGTVKLSPPCETISPSSFPKIYDQVSGVVSPVLTEGAIYVPAEDAYQPAGWTETRLPDGRIKLTPPIQK